MDLLYSSMVILTQQGVAYYMYWYCTHLRNIVFQSSLITGFSLIYRKNKFSYGCGCAHYNHEMSKIG